MTKKSNKRPPVRSGKKSGLSKKAIMLIAMSVGLVLVIVALIVLLNVWKSKPENQPTPSEPTVEATVEETAEPTAEPEPEFTDVDFGSATSSPRTCSSATVLRSDFPTTPSLTRRTLLQALA